MLVLIHIETRSKAGARGGSTEGVKHTNGGSTEGVKHTNGGSTEGMKHTNGGSTEGVKHMNSVRTMYMDREYRQIQVITIICLRYQL